MYLDERVELVTLNLVFVLTYGNIFKMICLEPSASAQSSTYMAKKEEVTKTVFPLVTTRGYLQKLASPIYFQVKCPTLHLK